MKLIKNTLCLILCIVTALTLASCGEDSSPQADESKKQNSTQQINYTERWVLEPSIEADVIYSLPLCSFNQDTNHYDVTFGSAYVAEIDGKLGFIDSNGDFIIEPKYDTVETCICDEGYIVTVKPENSYRETYSLNSSFSEHWRYPHKCEFFDGYTYKWNQQTNKAQASKGSEASKTATMPEAVIDAQSGKYALALSDKPVGEYSYDSAGVFTGGVIALSKGGKWGYVDYSGKEVIPFEYNVISGYSALGTSDTAYEASEGYITVLKGDSYGVFKTDGTQVVPCQYKSLTTVCDGRAFALGDNGKWGILEIDKAVSDGIARNQKQSDEATTSSNEE